MCIGKRGCEPFLCAILEMCSGGAAHQKEREREEREKRYRELLYNYIYIPTFVCFYVRGRLCTRLYFYFMNTRVEAIWRSRMRRRRSEREKERERRGFDFKDTLFRGKST